MNLVTVLHDIYSTTTTRYCSPKILYFTTYTVLRVTVVIKLNKIFGYHCTSQDERAGNSTHPRLSEQEASLEDQKSRISCAHRQCLHLLKEENYILVGRS
jgi:hypothetical protein